MVRAMAASSRIMDLLRGIFTSDDLMPAWASTLDGASGQPIPGQRARGGGRRFSIC
jgi:hypothetical protein